MPQGTDSGPARFLGVAVLLSGHGHASMRIRQADEKEIQMLRKTLASTAIFTILAAGAIAQTTTGTGAAETVPQIAGESAPLEVAPVVENEVVPTETDEATDATNVDDAIVVEETIVDEANVDSIATREGWELEEGWERVDLTMISAEGLIGTEIQSPTNEKVAMVKDVLMSPEGQIEGITASFGGFLGFGTNTVMLTLDEIDIVKDSSDAMVVHTNLTPAALGDRPEYEG